MVADRRREVRFLVLMAASGITGDQVLMTQSQALTEAQGVPFQMIEAAQQLNRRVYDLVLSSLEGEALAEELAGAFRDFGMSEQEITSQSTALACPYMRYFMAYDPSRVLSRTRIPVLMLQGDLDTQVVAGKNLPAIEDALKAAGNTRYTEKLYGGLNHLFQPAQTGAPSEYGSIDTTMDEKVMEDISSWILDLVQ